MCGTLAFTRCGGVGFVAAWGPRASAELVGRRRSLVYFAKGNQRPASQMFNSELQNLLDANNKFELYEHLARVTKNGQLSEEIRQIFRAGGGCVNFRELLTIVDACTWNSWKQEFSLATNYAVAEYPAESSIHDHFLPHETLCANINEPLKAVTKLMSLSGANGTIRETVLQQFELLVNKVVTCGSLAMLRQLSRSFRHDCCPELSGPLLCSTWVSLYLSSAKSDQTMSIELLKDNEQAMDSHLDLTVAQVAAHLLNGRQLNRYVALLQLFSNRSHNKKTKKLIEMLFHHFYKTNNVRGCLSCKTLANDLKVNLSSDIEFKYEMIRRSKSAKLTPADMIYRF